MTLLATLLLASAFNGPPSPLPSRSPSLDVDEALFEDVARVLAHDASIAPTILGAYGPSTPALAARAGTFGVGLQVGTPTSLTLKFPGAQADFVLGIGVGFGYESFGPGRVVGLSLHGDYLFTLAQLVNNGTVHLDAYVGPGLWLVLGDRGYGYFGYYPYAVGIEYIGLGVRMPLGLSMGFATAPLEIYLELDPALFVFPGVGGFLGASLGFRWYF